MPYKYLRDPLFLFCLVLYFINRWILKPHFAMPFLHNSLNDLICIPFWVPIMLWEMRKTGLRSDDAPPQWYEIIIPLIVWSIVFEIIVPQIPFFRHLAIADPEDIMYYTLGAFAASLFWRVWYSEKRADKASSP